MTRSFQRCFILLMDGARFDVLEQLIQQGRLPHLREVFFEQGEARKATTVFPSTSGPAYIPFFTGLFPGTGNIPGIRWIDREFFQNRIWNPKGRRSYVGFESCWINQDLSSNARTLFELLPPSFTAFNPIHRGISQGGNLSGIGGFFWPFYAKFSHHWSKVDQSALKSLLRSIDRTPRMVFVSFLGIDEESHLSHPHSLSVWNAYEKFDLALGKFKEKLEKENLLDSSLIFVISDHGMSPTQNHFELWKWVEERGRKTFYYPHIFRKKVRAASMISGNSMAHLYFKKGETWKEPMFHEELEKEGWVEELLKRSEVDHVLTRTFEGKIMFSSQKGKALGWESSKKIFYKPIEGQVFGYPLSEGEMSFQESLEKTIHSAYPDALVQGVQVFRSPRCGDMVVTSRLGFDLRKKWEIPEHFASHGSLHREHMMVPILCNQKIGLPSFFRTADLFPTILHLMGEKDRIPENIDGRDLIHK